jgi:hypothetical protein
MTVKIRFLVCLQVILLCSLVYGCGPFVVTETEYDAYGEVGSETVEYNDGSAPRVLSERGELPESAISNSGIAEQDDMREMPDE